MTTSYNRGFCFYCGKEVGALDYAHIGTTRVWCCGSAECERELRDEDQQAQEEAVERFREDMFGG